MKQIISLFLFIPLAVLAVITFPVKLVFYSLCFAITALSNAIIHCRGLKVKAVLDLTPPIKFKVTE